MGFFTTETEEIPRVPPRSDTVSPCNFNLPGTHTPNPMAFTGAGLATLVPFQSAGERIRCLMLFQTENKIPCMHQTRPDFSVEPGTHEKLPLKCFVHSALPQNQADLAA